jgi:threonyl-tRNA synthetase
MKADVNAADERPVIIHRAILGSVERMIAILTESFGGKWPFWLSPNQVIVITIAPAFDDYALKVKEELYRNGFECEFDLDAGTTLNKKVRNAQIAHYNFILVVGEKEKTHSTVNVRTRDNKVHGEVTIVEMIRRFKILAETRTNFAEDEFGTIPQAENKSNDNVEELLLSLKKNLNSIKDSNSTSDVANNGDDVSSKYC